jgi:hypothetical protein
MRATFFLVVALPFVVTGCISLAPPAPVVVVCNCKEDAVESKKPFESKKTELPVPNAQRIVPLCPAIAELSYPNAKKDGALINYFLAGEAKRQNISVEILSSFSARLRGGRDKVSSVVSNYPRLVCAFNQNLEPNDSSTYTSCMAHAKEWIEIVEKAPEELMLSNTLFKENCVTPG